MNWAALQEYIVKNPLQPKPSLTPAYVGGQGCREGNDAFLKDFPLGDTWMCGKQLRLQV